MSSHCPRQTDESILWPVPRVHKDLAQVNALWIVDVKDGGDCTAGLRAPNENGSAPPKVALPELAARIEKANDVSRERVATTEVRALVQITPMATPAPIVRTIGPTMLPGKNVFNMERGRRRGTVREVTVLAPLPSPFTDKSAEGALHQVSAERFRRRRAFA
jgi:hypothetical protein